MTQLIATNQLTLTNLNEKAIDLTEISFWHGLSATKYPLGIYDCGGRDHYFGNKFNVTSGKTYTVRVIAKQTKGSINLAGGIWYTDMTSGNAWDGLGPFTLVGEASEDGLGVYERKFVVASGKTKANIYIQIEQSPGGGSTTWRIYDGQVFDENSKPLVTDKNNYGALTSPMATPNGTYIWKRTITYYTDKTSNTIWEYSGVGAKGAPGPAGVSISNNKQYFILSDMPTGVIRTSGTWSTTPLTPTLSQKYVWTYLETTLSNGTKQYSEPYITGVYGDKGDQGVPGPPGKDGLPTYIHWAYSDNADGTGLTTSDNGQRYIGQYSDNTKTDSTDKTKYRWADRWAKIEVGGVNQISLTGALVGYRMGIVGENLVDSLHTLTKFIPVKYANYVLSYDGELDSNPNYYYSLAWYSSPNTSGFISRSTGPARQTDLMNGIKLTPPANATYLRVSFPTNFDKVMLNGGTVKLNWSQSPEDIKDSIGTKADQALTQQQLNLLSEKAQQMQTELEAKVAMETLSDLERAYKAYVEANNKAVAKSQADLIEAGRRVDVTVETLRGLSKTKKFIDTYIKEAEEGIIIGTNDNVSQIRVTHDRIAMYSAGKEVMYISQGVIHIDNGVFTKSLQIGRFITAQHESNPDINICRYVG